MLHLPTGISMITRLAVQAWGAGGRGTGGIDSFAEQVEVPEMAVLRKCLSASWRWQSAREVLNSAARRGNLRTASAMGRRAATRCTQQCALTGRQQEGPLQP